MIIRACPRARIKIIRDTGVSKIPGNAQVLLSYRSVPRSREGIHQAITRLHLFAIPVQSSNQMKVTVRHELMLPITCVTGTGTCDYKAGLNSLLAISLIPTHPIS